MSTFNEQIANNMARGLAIKFLQGLTEMDDITKGIESATQTAEGIATINKTINTNVNEVSESIAKSTARIKQTMAENAKRLKNAVEGNVYVSPGAPIVDFPEIEIPEFKIPEIKLPEAPSYPGTDHNSSEVIAALESTIKGLEFDLKESEKRSEVLTEQLANEKDIVSAITEDIQKSYNKMGECFNICAKYKEVTEALVRDINNQMHGMLLEMKQTIERKEG